jgi:selenocysteine lyase/cysteine desulfurase
VSGAVREAVRSWESGEFDWHDWERDAEASRVAFAELLGVAPSSIALVTSLAEAASTVAETIAREVPAGDVVVPAREFRSNLLPWTRLAEAGFTVRQVAASDDQDWTSRILDAIGERTRVVALSEVQSATGVRADVHAVVEKCRRVGARVFINGTQSVGALALQPWHSEADYLAVHGYKWMLAPRGAAFLYVRPDRVGETRPLRPNWKSVARPYDGMYGDGAAFAAAASRLDASLAWFSWVGARAALGLLASLDAIAVERHCTALAAELRAALAERGFQVQKQDVPSQIVSVQVGDGARVLELMHSQGVTASLRGGALRLGCHCFNDSTDVARLLAVCDALPPTRA